MHLQFLSLSLITTRIHLYYNLYFFLRGMGRGGVLKMGCLRQRKFVGFTFPGIKLARMRDAMGVFIMGDAYFGPFRISGYVSS